jgi:hypothetical protein
MSTARLVQSRPRGTRGTSTWAHYSNWPLVLRTDWLFQLDVTSDSVVLLVRNTGGNILKSNTLQEVLLSHAIKNRFQSQSVFQNGGSGCSR